MNFLDNEVPAKEYLDSQVTGELPFKTLWKGEFASIVSPIEAPYETLHEGDVVMVLAKLQDTDEFIIRKEFCPPYMVKDGQLRNWYTVLSGSIEADETKEENMIKEVQEEAGIKIKAYKIVHYVNSVPVCKSTTMRTTLYYIIITDYENVEAEGDGTVNEAKSTSPRVSIDEFQHIINNENVDFLLISMYHKMKRLVEFE